jgi:FlaA1/EpsC-like NDP-sugar epimerase
LKTFEGILSVVNAKSPHNGGGGGSIGAEISDRIVAFGASRLLVIENSEPALHAVLVSLATKQAPAGVEGRLADVRDCERILHLSADIKPDIVFHAAALRGGKDQCVRRSQKLPPVR